MALVASRKLAQTACPAPLERCAQPKSQWGQLNLRLSLEVPVHIPLRVPTAEGVSTLAWYHLKPQQTKVTSKEVYATRLRT